MSDTVLLHASCVGIDGKGVLLLGGPGSGKSDLALRMIEVGAALVADDQTEVHRIKDALVASPPDKLKGLLEARGVGILTLPYKKKIPLNLAVKLVDREMVERLPTHEFFDCLGLQLPLLSLHAFDSSTGAKIRFFLQQENP